MPSIAGFIQSLLSEDMYATGMLEKMDDRISQLNAGQLRLLVRFVENKIPGLTNKTVLDSYTKLLRKAAAETEKRHEEEVRGERERLSRLKAAHAGVNAKAWDTSHASLDRELVKFQKFLKSKARRFAEEEVLQEEMDKMRSLLSALPARRVAADTKRHAWWALGAFLVFVVGPILVLCLLPLGVLIGVAAFLGVCALAVVCWFVGVLRGIVVVPTLDDDAIEAKTRKRAQQTLKGYREEVRRTFEATEKIFAADMKWREDWVEGRKRERRHERRKAKRALKEEEEEEEAAAGRQQQPQRGNDSSQNGGGRIFPEGGGGDSGNDSSVNNSVEKTTAPKNRDRCSSGRILPEEVGGNDGGGVVGTIIQEHGPSSSSGGAGVSVGSGGGDGGASGGRRDRGPEVDEGAMGGEEGPFMGTPVNNSKKQVPQSGPGDLPEEPTGNNAGSCRASEPAAEAEAAAAGVVAMPPEGERGEAARTRAQTLSSGEEEDRGKVEATSGEDASNNSLLDRMRGPCQGSGLLQQPPRQGLEERGNQVLTGPADGRDSLLLHVGAAGAARTTERAEGSQQVASRGGVAEEMGDMAV